MAIAGPTRGCSGVVKVATTSTGVAAAAAMGSLTNWAFEETAERVDVSTMGTCTKAYIAGANEVTGTFDVLWDGDNAIQALMTIGSKVYFHIYPEGTASTANYYKTTSGGATILSVSRAGGGVDGVVSSTYSWAANGGLTATAV